MSHTLNPDGVLALLAEVAHPYLGRDIVELGMIKGTSVTGADISLVLELSSPACPARDALRDAVTERLTSAGADKVNIDVTSSVQSTIAAPPSLSRAPGGGLPIMGQGQQPAQAPARPVIRGVKNVVPVASGKGGVGKSTAAVNLALALAMSGARTGLIDADIHGPSVPGMLGLTGRPHVVNNMIIPLEGPAGLKVISMGFLTDADDPAILRGPMVTKFLSQFIFNVEWGELDYLLLDLPPGTGDVHLTLVQTAPVSGGVIITTPQDVAVTISRKGLRMFEKVGVSILGIIENMSYFVCPDCDSRHEIFSYGGGRQSAAELGVPFLGEIPIDPQVVSSGDSGVPTVMSHPDSPASQAYRHIAGQLAAQLAIKALGGKPFPQFSWQFMANANAPAWDPSAVSSTGERNIPAGIKKVDDGTMRILWRDGVESDIPLREIRLDCRCANCVEEMSGAPLLDPSRVPPDVSAQAISSIGVYAINIHFTDRHSSGIHSYDSLRALADRMSGG